MQFGPVEGEIKGAARQSANFYFKRRDIDHRVIALISDVKVRRAVLVVKHTNDNPIKGTDGWHGNTLSHGPLPPSSQFRKILFPEFGFDAIARGAALGFGGAQFDAANLARDGFRQFGEFEPPYPFEWR